MWCCLLPWCLSSTVRAPTGRYIALGPEYETEIPLAVMTGNRITRREALRWGGAGVLGAAVGAGVTAGSEPGEVRWQREFDAEIVGPATVVDGTVFVHDTTGQVSAVGSSDGELLWTASTGDSGGTPAVVVDGTVYITGYSAEADSPAGRVRAFDAGSGSRRWSQPFEGVGAQTVSDGTVYLHTPSDLRALAAADGTERWRFGSLDAPRRFPVVAGETVLSRSVVEGLSAVSAATGGLLWEYPVERRLRGFPAVAGGTAFFSTEGWVHAVDIETGEARWTVETGVSSLGLTVDSGRLFAGTTDGVRAFDTASGEQVWRVETGELVLPTVVDGHLLFSTTAGLRVLDAETGESVRTVETGGRVLFTPVVVDGTAFVPGLDERQAEPVGRLYAIETGVDGRSTGSRVRLGAGGHHGEWADQAPTAMVSYEPTSPEVGEQVTFDAGATTGDIERYEWDLTGDGTVDTTGETATRALDTPGRYRVGLTATDSTGETTRTARDLSVPATRRWRVETGNAVGASATVTDGTVFVGSETGDLYALDVATGETRWTFDTGWPVRRAPAVVGGRVFVGAGVSPVGALSGPIGAVYALDAASGDLLWEARVPAVDSSPTVVNGTVFVGDVDGLVHALSAASGGALWTAEVAADSAVRSSPTVVDGTVLIGGQAGVYALDVVTGDTRWLFETEQAVRSSPTVADGRVVVGRIDGSVSAVAAATGEERWTTELGPRPVRSSPTVVDGRVFVGSNNVGVHALDLETGEQLWTSPTDRAVTSSPTVAGDTLYVGGQDGSLYAFELETGDRLWRTPVGNRESTEAVPVTASPTVADGVAVVGSTDGSVSAFDVAPGAYSNGSRVSLGTLGHHGEWRYADQMFGTDTSEGTDQNRTSNGDGSAGPSDGEVSGGDDAGDGTETGGDGRGPGFGVGSALAGLGGAGYLLWQRRNGEEGSN
jgi:outer membrane protein assembly factor BamB